MVKSILKGLSVHNLVQVPDSSLDHYFYWFFLIFICFYSNILKVYYADQN